MWLEYHLSSFPFWHYAVVRQTKYYWLGMRKVRIMDLWIRSLYMEKSQRRLDLVLPGIY